MPEPDSDIEDGFGKGYSYKRESGSIRQGFGAEIVGERLVALYKVPEVVKTTSDSYIVIISKHVIPWYKTRTLTFKCKAILMHDGNIIPLCQEKYSVPHQEWARSGPHNALVELYARPEPDRERPGHPETSNLRTWKTVL